MQFHLSTPIYPLESLLRIRDFPAHHFLDATIKTWQYRIMTASYLYGQALGLLLITPAAAYWRMMCPGTLLEGRVDPVVTPGKTSYHSHVVLGGNGFAPEMDYNSTKKSSCTSCTIEGDYSNYVSGISSLWKYLWQPQWAPSLYYQGKDGKFTKVPSTGGVVYYQ